MIACEKIPEEVWAEIFKYLPFSDKLICALVCKTWYRAVHTQSLHQNSALVFGEDEVYLRSLPDLAKAQLGVTTLVLKEISVSYGSLKASWDELSQNLTTLAFSNCDVPAKDLVEILSQCTMLKRLKLTGARDLMMSGIFLDKSEDRKKLESVLGNVYEIDLSYNQYLSDALFNRIMEVIPNVSDIILRGSKLVNSSSIGENSNGDPSQSVLTIKNIVSIIKDRAAKIKRLDFYGSSIDGISIQDISRLENLELIALNLGRCSMVSQEAVVEILQNQRNLQILGLDYCRRVFVDFPATNLQIFTLMKSVKEFSIRGISAPRHLDNFDTCLSQLDKLEKLDISELDVPGSVVAKGLNENMSTNTLKSLYMISFGIHPADLSSILIRFRNLTTLNLSNCQEGVADSVLQTIAVNLVKLKILGLRECRRLTDLGFTGIGEKDIPNFLEEMKKEGKIFLGTKAEAEVINDAKRKEILDEKIDEKMTLPMNGNALHRIKYLTHLDIRSTRVTSFSIKFAFNFKDLRVIDISLCSSIDDEGFELLGSHNPRLEKITAKQCQVSDQGLIGLTSKTRRLTFLDIEGCKTVTNVSLSTLPVNCPNLRFLDVSFCNKVKASKVEELQEQFRNLEISLRGLHILECMDD